MMPELNDTDIIPRHTVQMLAESYRLAVQEIHEGYAKLAQAQSRLTQSFDATYGFDAMPKHEEYCSNPAEAPGAVCPRINRAAWRAVVDRMGVRQHLSIKRSQELDAQLEGKGEALPDLNEANVFALFEKTLAEHDQCIDEAVREVFELLRPHRSEYKTNSEFEVPARVILSGYVDNGYSSHQPFHVSYNRDKELLAINNVFFSLDGRHVDQPWHGELGAAIDATPNGRGETAYFRFKCHRNRNLHLEFKRLDLLAKLNTIAGGLRLRGAAPAKA